MEKKKQNISKIIQITIILLIILGIGTVIVKQVITPNVRLTQLQDNSSRQMMGYIMKTSTGKVIVIDGGLNEDEPNLVKHIQELGNKVDIWFITHPHEDHASAIIKVIEETDIPIEKIYYTMNDIEWYKEYESKRAEEAEKFCNALQNERVKGKTEEVTLNQIINIDFIKCEILGVKNPEITNNGFNNSSMVIKMNLPKSSILFLGDTGEESGDKLLNTQKDKLKSDIVQVAHHGQSGAKESLYKEINPRICLWPTPEWLWNNDSGGGKGSGPWTTLETRQWMENLGVKIHVIEKDGDTTIKVE
ncbi:MAG: hypothetical protein BHV99_06285 [Clostridium sp. 26_21]|nr:MAG: hypothetical protein BHV99_06285 [Clostridium sp. 26_21]